MMWFKKFLAWCGGTPFDQEGKTVNKHMVGGWIVLVLTIILGFFICIELMGYFESANIHDETASVQPETPTKSMLPDSAQLFPLDSVVIPTDEAVEPAKEEINEEGFNSQRFIKQNGRWLGISLGILFSTFLFLFLRWVFSLKDIYQKFQRFLWWCAGARVSFLEKCPTDHAKYFGIGGTVLFTALMATFAGGYAFFTAFDHLILSILFGLFWGALIFNLDRYIVSSTGKGDGTAKITKEEFFTAIPRLALAILIAFVVATPLELRIFQKEIKIETQKIIDEKRQELIDGQNYNLEEIQRLKNEMARLGGKEIQLKNTISDDPRVEIAQERKDLLATKLTSKREELKPFEYKISNYEKELRKLNQRINNELSDSERRLLERRSSSLESSISRNEQKASRLKKEVNILVKEIDVLNDSIQKIKDINADNYGSILAQNRNTYEKLEQQLSNIQTTRQEEIKRYEEIARQYTGLMAQLDALDRLSKRTITTYVEEPTNQALDRSDSTSVPPGAAISNDIAPLDKGKIVRSEKVVKTPVFYAKWLISLLFICIEIAPILFKMMTEAGPYDDLLEEEQYKSRNQMRKNISDFNEEINTTLKISALKNQNKLNAEVQANKELLSTILDAQQQIAKLAIEAWRDEQLDKAKANPQTIVKVKSVGNGQLED